MKINTEILAMVVTEAKDTLANLSDTKVRLQWIRAIDKAYKFLLSGAVEIKPVNSTLGYKVTMKSPNSGSTYMVDDKRCTCAAHQSGIKVCWHRACLRLLQRAWERQNERKAA